MNFKVLNNFLYVFQTPDSDQDLLSNIVVTLLKKLSSEIAFFNFLHRQFLQLCFKYASEPILVEMWNLKYQKPFKTLIRSKF